MNKFFLPLANTTSRVVGSPHYGMILKEYNKIFEERGKVNELRFFREVVSPLLPGYNMSGWYKFVNRYKSKAGLAATTFASEAKKIDLRVEENRLANNLLSNEIATQQGIQTALNIGASRLRDLQENPQLVSIKDAMDLLFKAMKAQDSRVSALGKIKADSREEEKFNREFNQRAYGETA